MKIEKSKAKDKMELCFNCRNESGLYDLSFGRVTLTLCRHCLTILTWQIKKELGTLND